jgi:hypothetical protein
MMSVEHWWTIIGRAKPKCSEENLPLCAPQIPYGPQFVWTRAFADDTTKGLSYRTASMSHVISHTWIPQRWLKIRGFLSCMIMCTPSVISPSRMAQAVTRLSCIWEAPSSNLSRDHRLSWRWGFSCIYSGLSDESRDSTSIVSRPLSSLFFYLDGLGPPAFSHAELINSEIMNLTDSR